MNPEHPFYAFSDSSWNDDVDTGRSTGGCLIWYLRDGSNDNIWMAKVQLIWVRHTRIQNTHAIS